jgi:hypothetical protein
MAALTASAAKANDSRTVTADWRSVWNWVDMTGYLSLGGGGPDHPVRLCRELCRSHAKFLSHGITVA